MLTSLSLVSRSNKPSGVGGWFKNLTFKLTIHSMHIDILVENSSFMGIGCLASAIIGDTIFVKELVKLHTKKANAVNSGGNVSEILRIDR